MMMKKEGSGAPCNCRPDSVHTVRPQDESALFIIDGPRGQSVMS